ncbi:hypothetical protein CK489_39615 [Bradyrhizobium sp. UFLA03-84]|uniref:hypothetical protein n=1 Tax=Bradyrhizobium sp. UFLA03-84 TaxID=418599 RepID=UPI000BADED58|nr:hypothetical protein [Bradyrhizobium sp. UFLA03-84]PAY03366.1 hypothetical protein CK489_39615 [Bradyrhizobium sp. UFLA03-84]
MFKKKTLFVLGAGSSYEVNVPVGLGLAKAIGTKLDVRLGDYNRNIGEGDKYLLGQFQNQLPQQFNEYLAAGWRIRDGLPTANSIDDFLDMHSHDEQMQLIGKAAIVKSILEAEQESQLYFDQNNSRNKLMLEKLEGSWFMKFIRVLGRGIPKSNAAQIFDNVSFVVFNYDRCVEFFLLQALQAMYSLPLNDAASIVQDLSIIHPYGTIGELPHLGSDGTQVPFGGVENFDFNYIKLSQRIKTYTEQIAGTEVTNRVRNEVERAEQVVFLGFAYHAQNMLLLRPLEEFASSRPIYGTALGMSASDVAIATGELRSWFLPDDALSSDPFADIHIENGLTCAKMFDNYAKSIAGG